MNKPKNKGGRPPGSTTKPRLADHLSHDEIMAIVNKAKELAIKGNENMIKLIVEQHFGKAAQAVDVTSDGEKIQSVVYLPSKK